MPPSEQSSRQGPWCGGLSASYKRPAGGGVPSAVVSFSIKASNFLGLQ